MAALESGTLQPAAREADFGRYPAVKEVPGGFDFQSTSVHHPVKHVILAHSAEALRTIEFRIRMKESLFARDRHRTTHPAGPNCAGTTLVTSSLTPEIHFQDWAEILCLIGFSA